MRIFKNPKFLLIPAVLYFAILVICWIYLNMLSSHVHIVQENHTNKHINHHQFENKKYDKESETDEAASTSSFPPYTPQHRLVHFDLKGAPPKISYFEKIFPIMKKAGATGLLIEYEDMFPFSGSLSSISAYNKYSAEEVRYIIKLAKHHGFEVIPLIQTFGHLEFMLKLSEFIHLREVQESPQSVCPTNNGTFAVIKTMIDEVLAIHHDAKWLHIGCDEVYQLGKCSRCSQYDAESLFLTHVVTIATYIRFYYNITPIIWDDMLRHISTDKLVKYELGMLVEPMVWTYVEDIYKFIPKMQWRKYSQVFPFIWSASAFKGAFGETLTAPDVKRHLENNKAWLKVMIQEYFVPFRGIALTGWQRYDHFASLCELLPAGFPSLIINLLTVTAGKFDDSIFSKMKDIFNCSHLSPEYLDLEEDYKMWQALENCDFPGSSIFKMTYFHHSISNSIEKYVVDTTINKGWLTQYNINHNFSSPLRINELLKDFRFYNRSINSLQKFAIAALQNVYEDDTVSEWIELNIYPYVEKLNRIWKKGQALKEYKVWPRRPLQKFAKTYQRHDQDF